MPRGTTHSPETRAQAITMRRGGMLYSAIGKELGVATSTIFDWVKEKKKPIGRGGHVNTLDPAKVSRIKELATLGKSPEDIAIVLDVSKPTVVKYSKGIMSPSRSVDVEMPHGGVLSTRADDCTTFPQGSYLINVTDQGIKLYPCTEEARGAAYHSMEADLQAQREENKRLKTELDKATTKWKTLQSLLND